MNFTLYRTSVAYSSSKHHHEQEHRGVLCKIKMLASKLILNVCNNILQHEI